MPDLRHTVLKVQWPDGTYSTSNPFEWEEFLTLAPAANISFTDEEGNPRKDTTTFEEVLPLSQTTLDSLFDAWSQLRNIVAKYETTLQNRWSKKSSKQRKEILLQVWPKMSSVHRPEFDLFRKERKIKGYHRQDQVETDIALRFPFINTEDLSLPKPLLLMLASRSRSFPCVFANADRDAIRVGIRSKMLVPKYIRGYSMYLNGEQTRETYGRLVSWEYDRQAIFKYHKGVAPDPGMGLMLLEIQRDILQLLVACSLSGTAWNEALCRVLTTAYSDMFLWQAVSRLFDKLMITCTEQRTSIRRGQILPDAYMEAVSHLGHALDNIMGSYLDDLPSFMAAVPTFKQQIAGTLQPDGRLFLAMKRKSADHLYWLFTELAIGKGTQQNQQICGLSNLTQEIETLISKDAQQKKRLTWGLIRFVSDVAVIAEMERQLGLSSCNEYTLSVFSQEENNASGRNFVGPLREINDAFCNSIWLAQENGLPPLVTDLRAFKYPSDKPRTAANIAKMRSAEHALDVLWERVYERVVRKTGKTLKGLGEGKIQHRDIQRTPPWTDPHQFTREIEGEGKCTEELDVSLALSILEERTERTIDPTKPSAVREKVKTRSLPVSHAQSENPGPTSATNQGSTGADQTPRLSVRKKAFNTFAALFGKLSLADKLPGELPWTDFKKAMVNVGFGAEKLQGSGWLFESKSTSILFHEPHPHSKLPMQWARRIARRLNRNLGWTIDTFVLEDGTDNDNANSITS
ncbi:MAG: hypothetical protein Q9221_007704 [Calogaya cf. arnoldii]